MAGIEFDYKWVAEKLGVPTLFCLIIIWIFYQAGSWTANKVVDPIVQSHTTFLMAEKEKMSIISDAMVKQTANMDRQSRQMEQHTIILEKISKSSEEIKNDQKKFPAVSDRN